jgi:UDP-glucose 4-epimerase
LWSRRYDYFGGGSESGIPGENVHVFVTGAAGFIGSHLVDRYLTMGHTVTGFDNFSTGQELFLSKARSAPGFDLVRGDLLDLPSVSRSIRGADLVLHLAANADVRFGLEHPRKDLEQNTIATWNVLEAMRQNAVYRLAFASTGSVYGEAQVIPTPEDCPFPVQTSLYGASKLAAEGLITAYAEGYRMQACIFRFVSILGPRYTHGHIFDFLRQLQADSTRLTVLGNGRQRKSYLYVEDCVDAIVTCLDRMSAKVGIFNLGTDEYCEVVDSIGWISDRLGVKPRLEFTGGDRGWVGDNPFIFLDCSRARSLGWKPRLSIREAVIATVDYLMTHADLLDAAIVR